jgi:indole-3-glycerol phosphate synthase
VTGRPQGILREIVERTRADVDARRGRADRRELEARARARAGRRPDFAAALTRGGDPAVPVRFICEIKKASPSKGVLRADLDPERQAALYAAHGAAAVSVVTEPHFFRGEDGFLARARAGAGKLPLLRKDFHIDELQILEAAAGEADAILLLVGVLSPAQLKDYLDLAAVFGLGHLAEVNDPREAEAALAAGARVIGVNNRDLATFAVDPARTEAVLPVLRGTGVVSVAESGIGDRAAVLRMERAGVDGLLVGEALVTALDPAARLRDLRGEAGAPGGAGDSGDPGGASS